LEIGKEVYAIGHLDRLLDILIGGTGASCAVYKPNTPRLTCSSFAGVPAERRQRIADQVGLVRIFAPSPGGLIFTRIFAYACRVKGYAFT
jgi:hypothetical protein